MLRTFLQVMGITLTLLASIFLLQGNLGLTPDIIADLASTHWGHNMQVVSSLSSQVSSTKVGLGLILSAFLAQLANTLWPMRIKDFGVSKSGVILALGVSVLSFVLCTCLHRHMSAQIERRTASLLEARGRSKEPQSHPAPQRP